MRAAKAFSLDTNCIVALLQTWHQFHEATRNEYERRSRGGEHLVVAPHALLEAFAVLTRMPDPHRVPPAAAERMLTENFRKLAVIPDLLGADCWTAIAEVAANKWGGGRVYDGIIARSSRAAGATVLLTWNGSHFTSMDCAGLEVREPGKV